MVVRFESETRRLRGRDSFPIVDIANVAEQGQSKQLLRFQIGTSNKQVDGGTVPGFDRMNVASDHGGKRKRSLEGVGKSGNGVLGRVAETV